LRDEERGINPTKRSREQDTTTRGFITRRKKAGRRLDVRGRRRPSLIVTKARGLKYACRD